MLTAAAPAGAGLADVVMNRRRQRKVAQANGHRPACAPGLVAATDRLRTPSGCATVKTPGSLNNEVVDAQILRSGRPEECSPRRCTAGMVRRGTRRLFLGGLAARVARRIDRRAGADRRIACRSAWNRRRRVTAGVRRGGDRGTYHHQPARYR